MFSSESWLSNQQAGFYNNVATQSLRFEPTGFLELTKTSSPADTNNKIKTLSMWVKRAKLSTSQALFSVSDGSNEYYSFYFDTNNNLGFIASQSRANVISTNVFRDVSAWYHITLVIDTTQATNTNRIKLFVNNSDNLISPSSSIFPSQNITTIAYIAPPSGTHYPTIGDFKNNSSNQLSAYLSEVNMIDGQALDASYFGETKNGVWIAKKYTGSYGTNGFRLQFDQTGVGTASASTIGADTSGNTNHFTSSGIVASDCNMPDSPENNFATWNPLRPNASMSYSEGNLNAISSGGGGRSGYGTIGMSTGKWYFETLGGDNSVGIADTSGITYATYSASGSYNLNGTTVSSKSTYTTSDIISVAYDADGGNIEFFKNGSSEGSSSFTDGQGFDLVAQFNGKSGVSRTCTANFGQDSSFAGTKTAQGNTDANGIGDFYYAPPSGYLALCTSNLPEPTISPNADTQADDYFNTVLYTGNGSNDHSITGVGFQPDWIWFKKRSGAQSHSLFDSTRGTDLRLQSDTTSADATTTTQLESFDSDGFTVNTNANVNGSSATYVAWNWKANGGTTVTNEDGSLDSTVQANTTAGFSIVTWTGNQTNGATIGHGLNQIPQMIIHKNRSVTDDWSVYTETVGTGKKLFLNDTIAETSTSNHPTTPTNSVFYVGAGVEVNGNGNSMLAYCFASVEGYSKIGSYTANGSTDGTFVYLGFLPSFILSKKSSSSGNWGIWDKLRRNDFNPRDESIRPDENIEAYSVDTQYTNIDFVSNGFKIRNVGGEMNQTSGDTYIYMAFAEAPFKYANSE